MIQLFTDQDAVRNLFATVYDKMKLFHIKLEFDDKREPLIPGSGALNQSFSMLSYRLKFEKIPILEFDRDILKFDDFCALFENLVLNNTELSKVLKLHYLKEAFVDGAKDAVHYIDLSTMSYDEAWQFVVALYRILGRSR